MMPLWWCWCIIVCGALVVSQPWSRVFFKCMSIKADGRQTAYSCGRGTKRRAKNGSSPLRTVRPMCLFALISGHNSCGNWHVYGHECVPVRSTPPRYSILITRQVKPIRWCHQSRLWSTQLRNFRFNLRPASSYLETSCPGHRPNPFQWPFCFGGDNKM